MLFQDGDLRLSLEAHGNGMTREIAAREDRALHADEGRNVTAIVQRGRATLADHEQFVDWGMAASEAELRAMVSRKGDDRRHADPTAFFISTPATWGIARFQDLL